MTAGFPVGGAGSLRLAGFGALPKGPQNLPLSALPLPAGPPFTRARGWPGITARGTSMIV